MKLIINIIASSLLMTGCTSSFYFQIYHIGSDIKEIKEQGNFYFEDENCLITYSFWSEGGNTSFTFYNKTDSTLYLNLDHSFFVLNGIANNYFKNRLFSQSSARSIGMTSYKSTSLGDTRLLRSTISSNTNTASSTSRIATTQSNSVTFYEQPTSAIPPKAMKSIKEYSITGEIYRNCDLLKFPKKNVPSSVFFNNDNSPYQIRNILNYQIGVGGIKKDIDHSFYVSKIENLHNSDVIKEMHPETCGNINEYRTVTYNTQFSEKKFYLTYLYSPGN